MASFTDKIQRQLDEIACDDRYRIDAVLKSSPYESTERVSLPAASAGAPPCSFIRKTIDLDSGLGFAYKRVYCAQLLGAQLSHLPRIYECSEQAGNLVVVMELVPGETLASVVDRCGPSFALAADLFPRICDAVSELHEHFHPPIIHRDLKPSNIMVSSETLHIIDFGIARSYDDAAESDTRKFGTPSFAPPEQFGFGQTDVRSDVYALGALLFFMLTGRAPSPSDRRAGFSDAAVPEAVRTIIARASAFDPERRFESARKLREAFVVSCSGSRPAAETPPRPADSEVAGEGAAAYPGNAAVGERGRHARGRGQGDGEAARVVDDGEAGRPGCEQAPLHHAAFPTVPLVLGVAWDCILLAAFALLALACGEMAIDPRPQDPGYGTSLAYRVVLYGCMLTLVCAPPLYAVSDRRPIRAALPFWPRRVRLREWVVLMCLEIAGFVSVGVLMNALE